MKFAELDNFKELLYLNIELVSMLFPRESRADIRTRLKYFEKTRKLIRLRKDFYIKREDYIRKGFYNEYFEVLACTLRIPSYLTLESVLRKYDILSEGTYGNTLVTTKKGIIYESEVGSFHYRHIDEKLFTGYERKQFLDYEYFEATKAKALFDYFYYRVNQIPDDLTDIDLVEEYRLNMDSFTKNELREFISYSRIVNKYSLKLRRITLNVEKHAHY